MTIPKVQQTVTTLQKGRSETGAKARNAKQYSTPAEKTAFCTSTYDNSDESSTSGYATSNTDGSGDNTEDSIDALYHLYNVVRMLAAVFALAMHSTP